MQGRALVDISTGEVVRTSPYGLEVTTNLTGLPVLGTPSGAPSAEGRRHLLEDEDHEPVDVVPLATAALTGPGGVLTTASGSSVKVSPHGLYTST